MCKKNLLPLFVLLSCFLFLGQDAGQLRLQEMNLWSKVELSLLSTQNEIDGLRNLVSELQTKSEKSELDSERLTSELMLSREDYNKLQLLQENTANSFCQLLTDYNSLKTKYELVYQVMTVLIWVLAIWIGIKILRVIIGIKFPILDEIIPRWVDILI